MALALLPLLGARMRTHRDAMVWLGAGMTAGLALVAAAVVAERTVFTGLFDFTTDYRVVGSFSSMNVGGGHIGAYIAMALPFCSSACFGHDHRGDEGQSRCHPGTQPNHRVAVRTHSRA